MPKSKPEMAREEEIRARAHAIWVRDGQPEGQDLAHWRQAEAELAAKAKPRAAPARKVTARASRARRKEAAE